MVDTSGHWWVESSRQDFDRIKRDPTFRAAFKLARATNAVLFCQLLLLENRVGDEPATQRLRLNAFLYLSALLFEAIEFAKTASKDLRHLAEFQSKFVPLFRNPEIQDVTAKVLKKLRNFGVFHFGDDAVPDALLSLDRDTYTFLHGRSSAIGDVYYGLADEALIHGALGLQGTPSEIETQLRSFITAVADLSAQFTEAADHVISAVLALDAWKPRGRIP
jgi:hypothetical protein